MKNLKPVTKRLILFGGIAVIFLISISTVYISSHNKNLLILLMLTPAASVILTRLITKEGTENLYLRPRLKNNKRWYFMAYFLPPFIAYFGALLYFLIFPLQFHPLLSGFAAYCSGGTKNGYLNAVLTTIPLAILVNPIMGVVQCFGEEFAWRGYLLPKLTEAMTVPKAVLLSSAIWGLWHAPIIATGFNYGTEHWILGIFAMVGHCIILGIIASYLFIKTKSVFCPTLFHAAINGLDKWMPSYLFMNRKANPFLGPDLTGVVGCAGFIFLAVVCLTKIVKSQKQGASV